LAEAAERHIGVPLPDFLARFESLGDACEFGLFQRRCGAEPLSLFRFTGITLENLILGLNQRFELLGDPTHIKLESDSAGHPPELMARETRYGMFYHTGAHAGRRSDADILAEQCWRLRYLRRQFFEDREHAKKVLVHQVPPETGWLEPAEESMLPLYWALRRLGTNSLLWLAPARQGRPPGSVERLRSGILKGYVSRFAPSGNPHDTSIADRLSVCCNAYHLSHQRLQENAIQ
jgi:hypothetical protein